VKLYPYIAQVRPQADAKPCGACAMYSTWKAKEYFYALTARFYYVMTLCYSDVDQMLSTVLNITGTANSF
jgi:hypothetical protein